MTLSLRPLFLSILALGLTAPAVAQDDGAVAQTTEAPATAPVPTEPAPSVDETPATDVAAPVVPAMAEAEFMGNPEYMLNLDLSTGGRVVIQLYPNVAPEHVKRVKELARSHFYDGIKFHRVIDGFMAQTGDPTATGQGGSQMPDLKAEFNPTPHLRGTVSMARAASDDSANSQFFIMFQPRFSLDRHYTVFGRVVSGMNYVDAIHRGEPAQIMSRMVQVSVAADNVPMPPASALTEAQPAPKIGPVSVDDLNAPLQK